MLHQTLAYVFFTIIFPLMTTPPQKKEAECHFNMVKCSHVHFYHITITEMKTINNDQLYIYHCIYTNNAHLSDKKKQHIPQIYKK